MISKFARRIRIRWACCRSLWIACLLLRDISGHKVSLGDHCPLLSSRLSGMYRLTATAAHSCTAWPELIMHSSLQRS